ncbi:MAG: hypothetical protein M1837_003036 [Sclerophora amabilis]|nr:MAG: hypothetical protein M1837_003036 [Sclerophora amabilis]
MSRAHDSEGDVSGHAFMVSCPPESHIIEHRDAPFDPNPAEMQQQLGTLLETSRLLDLDGEITPVMAWGMITDHPRVKEITTRDYDVLKEDLKTKVRCYGFGAVLEDFEVRDALSSVFATKLESYRAFT